MISWSYVRLSPIRPTELLFSVIRAGFVFSVCSLLLHLCSLMIVCLIGMIMRLESIVIHPIIMRMSSEKNKFLTIYSFQFKILS